MAEELQSPEGAGPEVTSEPSAPSIDYPSSWRAEDRAHWDSTPEQTRKIIAAREQNWAKESEKYKAAHENWGRFEPVIQRHQRQFQEAGVDPATGFANFLQLDQQLKYGTREQKKQIFDQLTRQFFPPEEPKKEYLDPEVGELRSFFEQKMAELSQGLSRVDQRVHGIVEDGVRREIGQFSKNPEHKHFDKLGSMMGKFITAGLAPDMDEAYKMALLHHPELVEAAKTEQKQQVSAVKTAQTRQALQAAGVNVRGNGKAPDGQKPNKEIPLKQRILSEYDRLAARAR